MNQTLHFSITGTVQGVGYRYSMQRTAIRLGLTGWVRNRCDGSVEAIAHGPEAALQELILWTQRGPSAAAVDQVITTPWRGEKPVSSFQQFATV